jgi:PAS domain S-box-containing protein
MAGFSLIKWFRNVSIAKKLYFSMGIMAVLIAIELLTLGFAIRTLSSVRAFVGGEGLWSKAQKDAIFHLERYGHTHSETDFLLYEEFMRVPGGDYKARMELNKPNPDLEKVYAGFIEGRNHEDDVEGMVWLFRNFYWVSYIRDAIQIWTDADNMRLQLIPIADRLHATIQEGKASQAEIDAILHEISPINNQLTRLEDDFSFKLGEGSRWLENLIMKILLSLALTVEVSGLLLTISVTRRMQKGLNEIIVTSEKISNGDSYARARVFSKDEIGQLAQSFNRMTDELQQNISELGASRALLKTSEERMGLLVDNIKDYAIVMLDQEGKILSWNEGASGISGYASAEIVGEHISTFFTEEDVNAGIPVANLLAANERGEVQTEGWQKRKDGSLFWAHITVTRLLDEHKKMRGYVAITRDITEQMRAETAIRQSRAQLAMSQQLAHIGSWELDLETKSLNWSDELYHIYGNKPTTEEIRFERMFLLTHPADREFVMNTILDAINKQSSFDFRRRIVRSDGAVRVLHSLGEVIFNESGAAVKMVGADQDITDRLHEEEMEKLAMAATKSFNSVIIANSEGKIEWVNEGFTKLTGYTFEEVQHTHGEVLRRGALTGLSSEMGDYQRLLQANKPVVYESKNYSKSGHEYWVITTLTPVIGHDGKIERIIAIDSDISERKKVEEDLILSNRIAEHSLKKGNKALSDLLRAKKELEESMTVKEQFLAKMSHEIRTPMNAIVGLSEIMMETPLTADQKECMEAISLSSQNLLAIINDILDFSRLSSGKVELEALPFRPSDVIDGVLRTVGFSAKQKGIEVVVDADITKLPEYVIGDSVRLGQIILNLVGNAIKFTENGRITVTEKMLAVNDGKVTLQFIVSDTGIGIPQDRLDTIFDSFTQASNETSRKYGGSGLGLTIVKQLAELHGGTVTVASQIGKGSAFTVTMQYTIAGPLEFSPEERPGITQSEASLDGKRILLAEDNEMNQMLARRVFDKWNFHLEIAGNGKIAVERLAKEHFDLVLMDVQMPEMDGYAATQFIRTQLPKEKSRVPIIAMTAHAIVGEAEKCIALGMNDYISKPFNRNTLYEKICALLKQEPEVYTEEEQDPKPATSGLIDLSYLTELAEGSEDFIERMIRAFLVQTPQLIEQLKNAAAAGKWQEVRAAAHKMKPSMDFIGIHALKPVVAAIENDAHEQRNVENIPAMIAEVERVCLQVMVELEAFLHAEK